MEQLNQLSEITQEKIKKNSKWRSVKRLLLFIILFHAIIFSMCFYLGGVVAINRYVQYFYILIVLFEIGFFSAIATGKYLRSAIISIGVALLPVLMMPFFLFVMLMTIIPIFIFVGIILVGVTIGWLLEKYFSSNVDKIIQYGLIVVFLVGSLFVVFVGVKFKNCETSPQSKDGCYYDKAVKHHNENICAKITNWNDKRMCYERVIFNFEYKNYKSANQCDNIDNLADREMCYLDFAKYISNEDVCNNFITDEYLRYKCHVGIIKKKCHKMLKKENLCVKQNIRSVGKTFSRCDVVGDITNKEMCYLFFAARMINPDICTYIITDKSLRNQCYAEVEKGRKCKFENVNGENDLYCQEQTNKWLQKQNGLINSNYKQGVLKEMR